MKKIIMMRGLPASGKTTWSTQMVEDGKGMYKRISKDTLRMMLDNNKWSHNRERFILQLRDTIVVEVLKQGKNIIIDDTNLNPVHEHDLRNIALEYKAEFEIKDFSNVTVEECIKRDKKRQNYVGEKVIREMYDKFLKVKVDPVKDIEGLKRAIICDLDGTLCLFGNKNPYDRDFENDEINPAVRYVLDGNDQYNTIVFVSGRSDKYRKVTEDWLLRFGYDHYPLFMRKEGDVRKDVLVKEEIYNNEIKGKYNVLFVLDDRDSIVEFWRGIGLTCFQTNYGNF